MNGIFKYSTHFKYKLQEELSLGEGNTPIYIAENLARKYGINNVYLKDESKNPSGSFKDRGIAYQLSYYKEKGFNSFTISSTGNAAASASMYCKRFNLNLTIFISNKIASYKLARINEHAKEKSNIKIIFSPNPKKDAFLFAKDTNAINLRQSLDNICIEGYKTLGIELSENIGFKDVDSIFMPVSSGTGFMGLALGSSFEIPLYAIQTTKINTIAKYFDNDFKESKTSLASAISARVTPRKKDVINAIKNTYGFSYAISDEEIEKAIQDVYDMENIEISYDSALSIAGLKRALQDNRKIVNAICILTGI